MTPATSIFFFRPEFDDFLYAPIGAHGGEMPLSVLSALARSDLDPWQEAAELSDLPKDIATQRLASLISQLPGGRWTLADSRAIADRLIELLPRCGSAEVPLTETSHGLRVMIGSTAARLLICAAFAVTVFVIAAMSERSSRSNHVDVPAFNTVSPPQTSP